MIMKQTKHYSEEEGISSSEALFHSFREKLEPSPSFIQAQLDELRREIDTLFKIAQTLALNGEYQQVAHNPRTS